MGVRIISFFTAILILSSCSKKSETQDVPPTPVDTVGSPIQKKWVVTTAAGNGTASLVNGPALSATFHLPGDIAIAADGSLYVTDLINFRIRKIAHGQVSTFVGGSGFDIVNGIGAAAQFRFPYSITIDGNGNLYTTDENDPRIRKISSAMVVSTYAGTSEPGLTNGNADVAQFAQGDHITCDETGTIYVSEGLNNSIRKIDLTGRVTTIAPNYQFSSPTGIAIDKENNLYVLNRLSYNVLKITPAGVVSVFAGSGVSGFKDGNSNQAQFSADVRDLAIDKHGNLFLSDDNRIRKIDPQGFVSTIAGGIKGFNDGEGSVAQFDFPNGLAVDDSDNLYVADLNNNRIRKISFQ